MIVQETGNTFIFYEYEEYDGEIETVYSYVDGAEGETVTISSDFYKFFYPEGKKYLENACIYNFPEDESEITLIYCAGQSEDTMEMVLFVNHELVPYTLKRAPFGSEEAKFFDERLETQVTGAIVRSLMNYNSSYAYLPYDFEFVKNTVRDTVSGKCYVNLSGGDLGWGIASLYTDFKLTYGAEGLRPIDIRVSGNEGSSWQNIYLNGVCCG